MIQRHDQPRQYPLVHVRPSNWHLATTVEKCHSHFRDLLLHNGCNVNAELRQDYPSPASACVWRLNIFGHSGEHAVPSSIIRCA